MKKKKNRYIEFLVGRSMGDVCSSSERVSDDIICASNEVLSVWFLVDFFGRVPDKMSDKFSNNAHREVLFQPEWSSNGTLGKKNLKREITLRNFLKKLCYWNYSERVEFLKRIMF